MIGEVTTLTTPSQYVVLRVTPAEAGWGAGVSLRATGVDNNTAQEFEETEEIDADAQSVVLRLGPYTRGSLTAFHVTLRNLSDDVVDFWSEDVTITNPNSPAVIVRQAIYDVIEDIGIEGAFILSDGLRRPASAAEDIPFVGGSIAIEVGPPSSQKSKKTPVRSEVTCEIPVKVYIFGISTGEAFTQADNICWQIQSAIDATPNLYLSNLGVNNYSWRWDVRPPEAVDVQGAHIPVVIQEMTITVPVIWVTASSS